MSKKRVFAIALAGGLAANLLCAAMFAASLYVVEITYPTSTPVITQVEQRKAVCSVLTPVYSRMNIVPNSCQVYASMFYNWDNYNLPYPPTLRPSPAK